MARNTSKFWPERILILGLGCFFFVDLHRDLPRVDWMFAGGTLVPIGILIALSRKALSRLNSVMWGSEEEDEAYRSLYLEFGVTIAIGGATLLLRAIG
jgi:hypothetical protein